jgi:hypothetical protein
MHRGLSLFIGGVASAGISSGNWIPRDEKVSWLRVGDEFSDPCGSSGEWWTRGSRNGVDVKPMDNGGYNSIIAMHAIIGLAIIGISKLVSKCLLQRFLID